LSKYVDFLIFNFFLMGRIFFFGWYSSDPDQELSGSKVLETLLGGGGRGTDMRRRQNSVALINSIDKVLD
jgi:hypothetical protein